jgi:hypothetical protein
MTVTTYWALVDLPGETPDDPGGLVRRVKWVTDDGKAAVRYEILVGDRWEDRTPSLVWVTMNPTHGNAIRIDAAAARRVEAVWPTLHARRALRGAIGPKRRNGATDERASRRAHPRVARLHDVATPDDVVAGDKPCATPPEMRLPT